MIKKPVWEYLNTYDLIPQQTKETNKLYQYYDNLKAGKLTTTKCDDCGLAIWPPRTVCPKCMSDKLSWVEAPEEGEILLVTVQENGVLPGFKAPLIFAVIRFGDIRITGKIIDVADPASVAPGQKVCLKVEEQYDGRVLPAFTIKS